MIGMVVRKNRRRGLVYAEEMGPFSNDKTRNGRGLAGAVKPEGAAGPNQKYTVG